MNAGTDLGFGTNNFQETDFAPVVFTIEGRVRTFGNIKTLLINKECCSTSGNDYFTPNGTSNIMFYLSASDLINMKEIDSKPGRLYEEH